MNKCYMMVGLPGVGKSTYVDKNFTDYKFVILSTDDIIQNIANDYGYDYNHMFKYLIDFANKCFFDKLEEWGKFDSHSHDLVIDRTNLSKKSRKKIIDLLPTFEHHAIVFSELSEKEHRRRLNSRKDKIISDEVIQKMRSTFEMPSSDEGFKSISFIRG